MQTIIHLRINIQKQTLEKYKYDIAKDKNISWGYIRYNTNI